MARTRLVTAGDLERLASDDNRYDLVAGRLVRMSPVGFDDGRVVARLIRLLGNHLGDSPERAGVAVSEVGFKLTSDPDTVRAPDVAFVRAERLPPRGTWGFPNVAPDAAIEVVSPDDTSADIRSRVHEYLALGVLLVVIVDPHKRTVTAHRRLEPPVTWTESLDAVDLGDVVDGFHCRLHEVFD